MKKNSCTYCRKRAVIDRSVVLFTNESVRIYACEDHKCKAEAEQKLKLMEDRFKAQINYGTLYLDRIFK